MKRRNLLALLSGLTLCSSVNVFAGPDDIGTPLHNSLTQTRRAAVALIKRKNKVNTDSSQPQQTQIKEALNKHRDILNLQVENLTSFQMDAYNNTTKEIYEGDHKKIHSYLNAKYLKTRLPIAKFFNANAIAQTAQPSAEELVSFINDFIQTADTLHLKTLAESEEKSKVDQPSFLPKLSLSDKSSDSKKRAAFLNSITTEWSNSPASPVRGSFSSKSDSDSLGKTVTLTGGVLSTTPYPLNRLGQNYTQNDSLRFTDAKFITSRKQPKILPSNVTFPSLVKSSPSNSAK